MSKQISAEQVRVFEAVRTASGWMTAREIAVKADVADRTARDRAKRFTEEGVFLCREVFAGFRYSLNTAPPDRALRLIAEIEAAKQIFVSSGGL